MDPKTGKTLNLDRIISTASYLNKQMLSGEDFDSDHSMVILAAQNKNKTLSQFRHKWSIRKEGWKDWKETLSKKDIPDISNPSESYQSFVNTIRLSVSKKQSLSKIKVILKKPGQPWWIDGCKQNVNARKDARKRFNKYPTEPSKAKPNKANKEARESLLEAKRTAWKNFLAQIGPQTPTNQIWKFFRAMKGHPTLSALPFCDETDNPLDPYGCAVKLGEHFAEKFSHAINLKEAEQKTLQETLLNNDEEGII